MRMREKNLHINDDGRPGEVRMREKKVSTSIMNGDRGK